MCSSMETQLFFANNFDHFEKKIICSQPLSVQLEYVGSWVFGSISAAAPWEGRFVIHPMLNTSSAGSSGCSRSDRFRWHLQRMSYRRATWKHLLSSQQDYLKPVLSFYIFTIFNQSNSWLVQPQIVSAEKSFHKVFIVAASTQASSEIDLFVHFFNSVCIGIFRFTSKWEYALCCFLYLFLKLAHSPIKNHDHFN